MIKLKNILMEQGPESKASDAVLGNPGKRVDVNPSNLEVYDINGDLLPTVPADLNQNLRTQNYREVTVTPKYYFQTKNMGETSYVKYDVKTGQLTDNKTGEELVKLNPGLPARQVYLWLRRNHFGKRDDRFQRAGVNESYAWERKADGSLPTLKDVQEAYDAKGVEDAADEVKEESKPDFLDLDKDGDKEEPMKKAAEDAEEVNEEELEVESNHMADEAVEDLDVLNMDSLEETFWSRVKGNLHGHEYILKEAFKK